MVRVRPSPPVGQKLTKIFSQRDLTIHTPTIVRVEFSQNMLLLNFFELISGQKNLKNNVKIHLFK
jgi:hypothetical protein